jgi:hypothetical protein
VLRFLIPQVSYDALLLHDRLPPPVQNHASPRHPRFQSVIHLIHSHDFRRQPLFFPPTRPNLQRLFRPTPRVMQFGQRSQNRWLRTRRSTESEKEFPRLLCAYSFLTLCHSKRSDSPASQQVCPSPFRTDIVGFSLRALQKEKGPSGITERARIAKVLGLLRPST